MGQTVINACPTWYPLRHTPYIQTCTLTCSCSCAVCEMRRGRSCMHTQQQVITKNTVNYHTTCSNITCTFPANGKITKWRVILVKFSAQAQQSSAHCGYSNLVSTQFSHAVHVLSTYLLQNHGVFSSSHSTRRMALCQETRLHYWPKPASIWRPPFIVLLLLLIFPFIYLFIYLFTFIYVYLLLNFIFSFNYRSVSY